MLCSGMMIRIDVGCPSKDQSIGDGCSRVLLRLPGWSDMLLLSRSVMSICRYGYQHFPCGVIDSASPGRNLRSLVIGRQQNVSRSE